MIPLLSDDNFKNCEICGLQYKSEKDHNMKHQDGNSKCCPHCDYKHEKWWGLRNHLENRHSEKYEKKYSCDLCGKTFAFEANFKKHEKHGHLAADAKEHVCHICGFSTRSRSSYFQ